MIEDELDHVLLDLEEEVFTGMVHQGYHHLQDPGHIVQHIVVTRVLQDYTIVTINNT